MSAENELHLRESHRDPLHMNLRQWPERERPREKMLAHGVQALSDAEVLAVLLGSSGLRGSNLFF